MDWHRGGDVDSDPCLFYGNLLAPSHPLKTLRTPLPTPLSPPTQPPTHSSLSLHPPNQPPTHSSLSTHPTTHPPTHPPCPFPFPSLSPLLDISSYHPTFRSLNGGLPHSNTSLSFYPSFLIWVTHMKTSDPPSPSLHSIYNLAN